MIRGRRRSGRVRVPEALIRVFRIAGVAAAVLIIPLPAGACTITTPVPQVTEHLGELAEYVDDIAVIFVGRQIDRRPRPSGGVTLVFEVDRVYKGQAGPLVRLVGHGAGNCGPYREGIGLTATWTGASGLLGVTEEGDRMLGFYSGTAEVSELEAAFGAGYPPDPEVRLPEPQSSEPLVTERPGQPTTLQQTLVTGIALVAFGAVLTAIHRRRGREER